MEYLNIDKEDVDTIIELTNRYLMVGKKIGEDIRESISEGNYFGMKAVMNGQIVGFMTYKEGFEFSFPKPVLSKEIRTLYPKEKIFTGDGLYVSEACRHKGVGGKLIELAREDILQKGGELVLTELWVYQDGSFPVGKVINHYGKMVYEQFVPGFYSDSKDYGLICPVCGAECSCSSMVRLYDIKIQGPEEAGDNEIRKRETGENRENREESE